MKEIGREELKTIQMDILDVVDRFCAEHEIRYSIACGTMLGAVRHGGYIPWDDDIDIYMLREDYQHFLQLMPEVYMDHYQLACLERTPGWHLAFAKVFDNRTIVYERKMKTQEIGVNIDIFVLDSVPDDEMQWLRFNRKRRQMFRRIQRSFIKYSKDFSLLKNLMVFLLDIRYAFFSRQKAVAAFSQYIQQFNGHTFQRVFETSSGMMCKQPFSRSLFDDLTEINFEDRTYKGFRDYDSYLRTVYGPTYMTPPPVNKRNSYHVTDNYWK